MRKKFKKTVALALTVAMVFSLSMTSVFAYSSDIYSSKAPTETVDVDKTELSGATSAANTTAMSILGINVTSTDTAGVLNAMSDTDAPLNLLVFGSDLNENPDPYLWNFYYNLNANGETYPNREGQDENFDESQINHDDDDWYDENLLSERDIELLNMENIYRERSSYMSWKGAYTLLNYAKAGPTGAATDEGTIPIRVNSTTATKCNPLFYFEPNVLMGGTDGSYTIGLDYYKSTVNSKYAPLEVYGWGTNDGQYAINTGTVESTIAMANGVYTMAVEIQHYVDDNDLDLKSRYNDGSVLQCGINYSNFAMGIYYYLQSRYNPNSSYISKISKAKYCTGISVAEYGGTITITNAYEDELQSNRRYLQYLDGISEYVEPEEGKTYGSYGDLAKDVDLIIMDPDDIGETRVSRLNTVGIKVVDIDAIMPETSYGTTMQSADNILGLPYFVGLLYEGDLSTYNYGLSEYDYLAYFVENIYHVKNECVDEVVAAMVGDGCGSGYDGLDHSYNYNDLINSMIQIGADYYHWLYPDNDGDWYAANDGWI